MLFAEQSVFELFIELGFEVYVDSRFAEFLSTRDAPVLILTEECHQFCDLFMDCRVQCNSVFHIEKVSFPTTIQSPAMEFPYSAIVVDVQNLATQVQNTSICRNQVRWKFSTECPTHDVNDLYQIGR